MLRRGRASLSRRYLKPVLGCLRRNRRGLLAAAETRYLERCLRRTGSDATHVTCVYPLLAAAFWGFASRTYCSEATCPRRKTLPTWASLRWASDNRRSARLANQRRSAVGPARRIVLSEILSDRVGDSDVGETTPQLRSEERGHRGHNI